MVELLKKCPQSARNMVSLEWGGGVEMQLKYHMVASLDNGKHTIE